MPPSPQPDRRHGYASVQGDSPHQSNHFVERGVGKLILRFGKGGAVVAIVVFSVVASVLLTALMLLKIFPHLGGKDFAWSVFISFAVALVVSFICAHVVLSLTVELRDMRDRLLHIVTYDGLTGIHSRAYVLEQLDAQFDVARRRAHPLSIIVIDVDHFKNINDTLGHSAGDRVLKGIATALAGCLRSIDCLGRNGGDEFLILLPDTIADRAQHICQHLLQTVRSTTFEAHAGAASFVTVSIGVATIAETDANFGHLLERADQALLQSKREGRDQFTFLGAPTHSREHTDYPSSTSTAPLPPPFGLGSQ